MITFHRFIPSCTWRHAFTCQDGIMMSLFTQREDFKSRNGQGSFFPLFIHSGCRAASSRIKLVSSLQCPLKWWSCIGTTWIVIFFLPQPTPLLIQWNSPRDKRDAGCLATCSGGGSGDNQHRMMQSCHRWWRSSHSYRMPGFNIIQLHVHHSLEVSEKWSSG